jgi:hypothetical protein
MTCFIRAFCGSDSALKEKLRIEELESAVLMLTAQLEEEKSEKASLEQTLSQVKSETDSFRVKSTSLRAAASMKMKRWWTRDSVIDTTCDGGSEKSATNSTADETIVLDSDTEQLEESTSEEVESKDTPGADQSEETAVPVDARLLRRRSW